MGRNCLRKRWERLFPDSNSVRRRYLSIQIPSSVAKSLFWTGWMGRSQWPLRYWNWPHYSYKYNSQASHDRDHLLAEASFRSLDPEAAFKRAKLGAVLLVTAVGIPMLWMGEEFGQSTRQTPNQRNKLQWFLLKNQPNHIDSGCTGMIVDCWLLTVDCESKKWKLLWYLLAAWFDFTPDDEARIWSHSGAAGIDIMSCWNTTNRWFGCGKKWRHFTRKILNFSTKMPKLKCSLFTAGAMRERQQ